MGRLCQTLAISTALRLAVGVTGEAGERMSRVPPITPPKAVPIQEGLVQPSLGDLVAFTGVVYPQGFGHFQVTESRAVIGTAPAENFVSLFVFRESADSALPGISIARHIHDTLFFGTLIPYSRYLFVVHAPGAKIKEGRRIGPNNIISISPLSRELGVDARTIIAEREKIEASAWRQPSGPLSDEAVNKALEAAKEKVEGKPLSPVQVLTLLGKPENISIKPENDARMDFVYVLGTQRTRNADGSEENKRVTVTVAMDKGRNVTVQVVRSPVTLLP